MLKLPRFWLMETCCLLYLFYMTPVNFEVFLGFWYKMSQGHFEYFQTWNHPIFPKTICSFSRKWQFDFKMRTLSLPIATELFLLLYSVDWTWKSKLLYVEEIFHEFIEILVIQISGYRTLNFFDFTFRSLSFSLKVLVSSGSSIITSFILQYNHYSFKITMPPFLLIIRTLSII